MLPLFELHGVCIAQNNISCIRTWYLFHNVVGCCRTRTIGTLPIAIIPLAGEIAPIGRCHRGCGLPINPAPGGKSPEDGQERFAPD